MRGILRRLQYNRVREMRGRFTTLAAVIASLVVTAGAHALAQPVMTGADVLAAQDFAPLKGLRVGLITNHTGKTADGERLIDRLSHAPGVTLAAIFTPEHGLYGDVDRRVASGVDPTTALPVYSLYGDTLRPTDAMLDQLQALVFDIQDAGARYYTYIATMAYAMEAAARRGLDFYVLDRPNPISASIVQGPVMDASLKSFTGYFAMPTRYGMTMGELARMFNRENHIDAALHVIQMRGYRRGLWYDDTGLPWIAPSPNLRTLTEAVLYTGVGMIEGANVSVGRGTDMPFEVVGAPWIDGPRLARYLTGRRIPGVRFEATNFTPSQDRYASKVCHGIRITLVDRKSVNAPSLGIEIIAAVEHLYPHDFRIEQTLGGVGSRRILAQIKSGDDPQAIDAGWQQGLRAFRRLREHYLLY